MAQERERAPNAWVAHPSARGGSSARGRGRRGRGGVDGSANLSWRPTPDAESTAREDASTPRADHGTSPSSLGTPAFAGGASLDPFGDVLEPPARTTPSNQISTLEVLGEDSESRRKRFESTLTHNRYLELKPLRELQRVADIKNGFIPDPLKPMRLDEATDFVGTCEEMCPEWEREEREYQKSVEIWERYPGTSRVDPEIAVKAFHRPAAGNEQPLPSDVRPPHVLVKTLDYLFHTLMPAHALHLTHPFLRDRTRAVRQDLTMQNERGILAIECNERIARYHVMVLGALREQVTFSESQELEQLRKVLKSLNEFYDDARLMDPPVETPNEPEFRAYNILTHLRDPDIIWSTELLPLSVITSPLLQSALRLHSLAQNANHARGEKVTINGWSRFFKLLAQPEIPYLFACILSTHFNDIRVGALRSMKMAYIPQHSAYPIRTLANVLGCDDAEETIGLCEACGLDVTAGAGAPTVELHRTLSLIVGTIRPRVSQRLVEAKRGSMPYQTIIDRVSPLSGTVPPLPALSLPPSSAKVRHPPVTSASRLVAALPTPPSKTLPSFGQTARTAPDQLFRAAPAPTVSMSKLSAGSTSFVPSLGSTPIVTPSTTPPSFPIPSATPFASTARLAPTSILPLTRPFFFPSTSAAIPPPPQLAPSVVITTPAPFLPSIRNPSMQVIPPSPARPSARSLMVNAIIARLADGIIAETTSHATQNVCESILRELWADYSVRETAARSSYVNELSRGLVQDIVGAGVRQIVGSICCDSFHAQRLRRGVFRRWKGATERVIEARLQDMERQSRIKRFAATALAGDPKGKGRELWSDEEEDDEYAELRFDELAIESSVDVGLLRGDATDGDMATLVHEAQETRSRLWSSGTFLNILARQIDLAFAAQQAPSRSTWSCIVSTVDDNAPFAAWLRCKFGFDEESSSVQLDTASADVHVTMVSKVDPADPSLASAGLVIFDCTVSPRTVPDARFWDAARHRLSTLLACVDAESIYAPSLLVVLCPGTLTSEEEASLRSEVAAGLALPSIAVLAASSICLLRLEDAEVQFTTEASSLLSRVVCRPGRVLRRADTLVKAFLAPWTAGLARCLKMTNFDQARHLPGSFIAVLREIALVVSRSVIKGSIATSIPPFDSLPSQSLAQSISTYIALSTFSSAAHFPLLQSVLQSRPLPSDASLLRLFLDHLADYTIGTFDGALVRQDSIDIDAPVQLARIVASVQSIESESEGAMVQAAHAGEREQRKRKAGLSPSEASNGHSKKQSISDHEPEAATRRDGLSALSLLINESKLLLSR